MSDIVETEIKKDEEHGQSTNITDFLQAPRKKRKNYIILALGDNFDQDLSVAMEGFLKKGYPNLSVSNPQTPQDLSRQFGRNISLLVMNDEFTDREASLDLVLSLKAKRSADVIPVLFLTRNPQELVKGYHNKLLQFHETDEFISYSSATRNQIFTRLKLGIETQNRRRSRRYKASMALSFFHLQKDMSVKGRFLDLSIHGALLQAQEDCLFKIGDQLKLSLPLGTAQLGDKGDFLKLSAKVRRVFISGNIAGISFEYMSPEQTAHLTKYLANIVTREMERKNTQTRIAQAKSST